MPSNEKAAAAAAASSSFMSQIMEYSKKPQYIMMFLGAIFLLAIGFMMYKKPDMLQKIMKPNATQGKAPPANTMNDDDEHDISQGADL